MKLTILGCNGPFAAPGGACSSYLVEHEGARVLLDCGPGALSRLEGICSIGELDAIVLSHLHFDHISDIFSGVYNLQQLKAAGSLAAPIPLLLPDEPQAVRALIGGFDMLSLDALHASGKAYRVGGMELLFLPVRHPLPAFAVRIAAGGRTLVYTGDTNTCAGLDAFCAGADMLLCDIGLARAQWSEGAPHLSAALGGELARDAHVGAMIGTHIHPRADRTALLGEVRECFPQACLAHDGMSVEI